MSWHYIQAFILGAVQGLTEFLPVSSSGHLVIAKEFLGIPDQGIFFDAILHLATLLAILIYFRLDWLEMLKSWINENKVKRQTRLNRRLLIFILIATIPAAIIGWFLNQWVNVNFYNTTSVAIFMLIIGFIFIFIERFIQSKDDMNRLNGARVIGVGLAQALAIIPGISRSGTTIVTGMYMGLRREVAAKFSFLLAAPIIAGAGFYSLYQAISKGIILYDWLFWIIAFVSSLIFGLLAIKFLLSFLQKYSLNVFAYYLLLAGTTLLMFNFVIK